VNSFFIPLLAALVVPLPRPGLGNWLFFLPPQAQNLARWLTPSLGKVFWLSGFLVCFPVFLQAPLVRSWPILALLFTGGWIILALGLMKRPLTAVWGDLLVGFSWSWFTGAIYWGWFRGDPFVHLPIEALGLPMALWGLRQRWGVVGHLFYLGSLLGTALTDGYFYLTGLMTFWKQVMVVEPALVAPIFHQAIAQIQNPWGFGWAVALISLLLGLGAWALSKKALGWQAFGGAILSTILVDSLFGLVALFA